MAIISQEKFFLKNHGQFKKIVKYTKIGFSIDLPEIVCTELNLTGNDIKVVGNSEDDVNNKFTAKIREWEDAVTIEEKIILFKAKFQGALATDGFRNSAYDGEYHPFGGNGHNSGTYLFRAHDLSISDCSIGMSMEWAVYNKKTVNGKSDYHFVSGRELDYHSLRNSSRYTEIPHTEEREQFFLQLDESFATMISKIHKALGDLTPEKLLLLSDSGMKLIA